MKYLNVLEIFYINFDYALIVETTGHYDYHRNRKILRVDHDLAVLAVVQWNYLGKSFKDSRQRGPAATLDVLEKPIYEAAMSVKVTNCIIYLFCLSDGSL